MFSTRTVHFLAHTALALGFGLGNRTFYNPGLPGWHSDPSCAFVPDLDNTTFCVTSSFPTFPGLPLYASRNLDTWYHVSNVFNRPEQVPVHASLNYNADEGFWAPTVRYHDGFLYVRVFPILLFKTNNPFDSRKWSMPIEIDNPRGTIDPDLFWNNDNGTVYLASGWGSIYLAEVNVETGSSSTPVKIWAGSGGSNPEGPHIFRKDGYFYLLVAEGGIGPNHSATIARSKDSIYGPYESYEGNPILTNRGTDEFFQTVGHADFFQDLRGEWWAAALATRRALDSLRVPMGRETVFTPVTWDAGEWPRLDPVRGKMTGWPRAARVSGPGKPGDLPAKYPVVDGADDIDSFPVLFSLPIHFVHHRSRVEESYVPSPPERPGWLKLAPSVSNLTGPFSSFSNSTQQDITFLARRQTASLFSFSVNLAFDSQIGSEEEAGITIFLTQSQHIDLGIISQGTGRKKSRVLRLRATSSRQPDVAALEPAIREIPRSWSPDAPIRLSVVADEDGTYVFSASSSTRAGKPSGTIVLGRVSSGTVSGGEGRFVGTLIGVYATTNGAEVKTRPPAPAYIRHWKYTPIAQEISEGEYRYI
ncbi:xylosidase : arabinofuranosidase [Aspergillus germanicus]